MTHYEMKADNEKLWDPTLAHFSLLFAQRKAYGDDRAANSGYESAAAIYSVPSDRTITTTASSGELSTRDLYVESLEESLAIAREYMATAPTTPTPPSTVFDPLATLRTDMDAQRKQFEALLKQNADLVATIAKTASAGNGGGTAPARTGRTGRHRPRANLKECPNCKKMCTHEAADCFSLPTNADKRPVGWRVVTSP